MGKEFDCSGYASRANILCTDGKTILPNAFKDNDGEQVPVVWNHEHNDPNAVLGHAILENRDDGIYAYIKFNDTESGQNAKLLVQNGDVNRLSVYANRVKQHCGNVIHGIIREISLVLAGANPEAKIDWVIAHGDDSNCEIYITSCDFLENVEPLYHADKENNEKGDVTMTENAKKTEDETIKDILGTLSEKQMQAVYALIGQLGLDQVESKETTKESKKKDTDIEHSDDANNGVDDADGKTIADVLDTLNPEQRKVVNFIVGSILDENDEEDEEDEEDDTNQNGNDNEGGDSTMKHNVFDKETQTENLEVLSQSEMSAIFAEAKRNGSLADTVLQHGITNIDYMFPEATNVDKEPGFIKRPTEWVADVMNDVHKTPFSRIRSVHADITKDEARAKGYTKGKEKTEEVFAMLKRVTTPTTVYKKQKLDRDDVVDITDFDAVAWLKGEMRGMLDEEIARAILVGDGRGSSHADKINEQNIRPIWTDDDVYTVKVEIPVTSSTTEDEKAAAFIEASIKSRKRYKGSGKPKMYMSEDMLTACLLLKDKNGRMIYDNVDKLATTLRVSKIVPVPVMEDLKRVKGANTHILGGIYVNLRDYNVGADKGGAVNMFDDFDIDYNAMKYLIETRCSGAMTQPYGAVAIEFVGATSDIEAE